MRQISREVQRGFLADLGAVVSVILGSLPSGARCRPVSSPEERKRGRRLRERQSLWRSRDYFTFVTVVVRVVSEPKKQNIIKAECEYYLELKVGVNLLVPIHLDQLKEVFVLFFFKM